MKSSSSGWVRALALVAFIVAAPSALAQVEPTDAICRSVREEKPKLKIRVHKVSEGTPAGFQITVAEYDENGDISFKDHRTGTGFLNVSIVKIDFNDVQIGTGELEASSNGESIGVYRPGKSASMPETSSASWLTPGCVPRSFHPSGAKQATSLCLAFRTCRSTSIPPQRTTLRCSLPRRLPP